VADKAVEKVAFVNEGWGDVANPILTFRTHALDSGKAQAPPAWPLHSLKLATFAENCLVKLDKYVPPELEDKDRVAVTGDLEFGKPERRQKVLFSTTTLLKGEYQVAVPPTWEYDLPLTTGKTPNIVRTSVSHLLEPGKADQFLLRVASDKSAHYDLECSIRLSDSRQLPAQRAVLDLLVPRSQVAKGTQRLSAQGRPGADDSNLTKARGER
jgi:hypothetical protein